MVRAMAPIVYLVRDLVFASKIQESGAALGIPVERAPDDATLPDAASGARLVIVDLRLPEALSALDRLAADPRTRSVPSVGFVDHENVDMIRAAAARGCRSVLSKRRFAAELPALLADAVR